MLLSLIKTALLKFELKFPKLEVDITQNLSDLQKRSFAKLVVGFT